MHNHSTSRRDAGLSVRIALYLRSRFGASSPVTSAGGALASSRSASRGLVESESALAQRVRGREKIEDTSNMKAQKPAMPRSTRIGVPSSPREWSHIAAKPVVSPIAV